MNFHQLKQEEVESQLQTSVQQGLTTEEAVKRQQHTGFNELREEKLPSAWRIFFRQFKDFMVLVLIAATVISALMGEYIDSIAILAIIVINGLLGFMQERKAEKSLQALKELSAPQALVLRDGEWTKLPSKDIVPGDVLKFSSGDRVGADVRLLETVNLEIEESAMTGESVPSEKTVSCISREERPALADMKNMAFMGTLVTRGSGVGVVTAIGMKTAMGNIASMLQQAGKTETPLQRRLEQLGKILIAAALFLTMLVVVIGVFQGHDLYTMLLAGVSLAVAAIPEGLPAIVTVALSLGVQRMIKRRAVVRQLAAVETLGCTTVICSDKTGTMTQNQMTVTDIWAGGDAWKVTGRGYEPNGDFLKNEREVAPSAEKSLYQLLMFGMLCNHAELKKNEKEYFIQGDPTEGALLTAALKAGLNKEGLLSQYTIEDEIPFDSERKMMTVIVKDKNGKRFAITKGAPDIVMEKCDYILWDEKQRVYSKEYKERTKDTIQSMASQALRVIAVAFKPLTSSQTVNLTMEEGLTFIGMEGMIDPPRPEVKQAVAECREAGIKTVMITGDHAATAKAIASQLGLLKKDGAILDGQALAQMSDEEFEKAAEKTTVYARVTPEDKLKIVRALQKNGHIVAMTGDGVNDAPAIKAADIGIAMGITGTDVAKEASSLVLADDNFTTIKSAVEEGRNIYENIRKFIRYLMASNVGEILVMLFAMILALPLPLVPIQILWVNLVTDGLPALALGLDKAEDDVMKRNPRHPKEGVFARGLGWKIISRGFLIGIVTLIAFIISYKQHPGDLAYAQTVAFATLVTAQLIHVFDCRSERSVLARNPFGNLYLIAAVISSFVLMVGVIYIPALQPIFHTVPLVPREWMLVIGMGAIPTFLLAGSFFASNRK
ncbi:Ca2+-transporting ATPase [Bacillus ectoiniformans]|uniref:calcium-translocating P-type ATPase, SERCA-type n=1 Tax=Bacillus ectoiniformans TaxID=1494429 RepID=UPI00195E10C8|nr:calcium-translocating P-type ATPase, SERCA-type [Bacillus ectoiniformans]MBM7647189.1 Ca2+-transporting ATPase [Bacillus ectoiniformans]